MADMSIEVSGADELARSLPDVNTRALAAAGAAEYKRMWRGRFAELDAAGNKKGWPSRHFWINEGARKTDVAEVTDSGARVTCDSRAVAMRSTGGTIRPRDGGALSIPLTARADAAGWPSNSGLPLEFVPIKSAKNPAVRGKLVEARATRIGWNKKKEKFVSRGGNEKTAGTEHYLLVSKSEIPAMGDAVLPDRARADEAVSAKMAEALERQIGK